MFGRHTEILKKYRLMVRGSEILPAIFGDIQRLHDEIELVRNSEKPAKPIDVSGMVHKYDPSGLMYNDVVELCLLLLLTREAEAEFQHDKAVRATRAVQQGG